MAKDQKAETEATEAGGGGKKKMIIIIALVVLVAIGASVGVTLFLLGGDDQQAPAAPAEPVQLPAQYLDLKPPIIVTYNYQGKQRFIQLSLSIMSRSSEAIDAIELHMPLIRNRLLNLYASKQFEVLATHEGRVALLEETRTTLNEVISEQGGSGDVEAVLYQNVVLQ